MNRYIIFVPCDGRKMSMSAFFWMHVCRKPHGRILGYKYTIMLNKSPTRA